jgi:hypothetical protein
MSTITWSYDLRTVVKNVKQLGLGSNERLSIVGNNSSLPHNEQNAIQKEFSQTAIEKAMKPITAPKEFWA